MHAQVYKTNAEGVINQKKKMWEKVILKKSYKKRKDLREIN